jgi:hypothetical protein
LSTSSATLLRIISHKLSPWLTVCIAPVVILLIRAACRRFRSAKASKNRPGGLRRAEASY